MQFEATVSTATKMYFLYIAEADGAVNKKVRQKQKF